MRVADLKKTALVYYYLSSIFCITSLFFLEFDGPVFNIELYFTKSHTHAHTHTRRFNGYFSRWNWVIPWLLSFPYIPRLKLNSDSSCVLSHVRRFDPIPERFHFRTFRWLYVTLNPNISNSPQSKRLKLAHICVRNMF